MKNYVGEKEIFKDLKDGEGFEKEKIVREVKEMEIKEGKEEEGYGVKFGKKKKNESEKMMGMKWKDGKIVKVYKENEDIEKMRLKK